MDNKIDLKPQTFLDAKGKKIFKELIENEEMKRLKSIDTFSLSQLAHLLSLYHQSANELRRAGTLTQSYTNKNGSTNEVESPHLKNCLKLLEKIVPLSNLFGLSPVARQKLIGSADFLDDEFDRDFK